MSRWAIFVVMFTLTQNRWKIDDVLGVWPLHGLVAPGAACPVGIFGSKALGGGVSLGLQLLGTLAGVAWALGRRCGTVLNQIGLRLSAEGSTTAPV